MSTWTPERENEAARRWKNGESASQIARRLGGITRNAVIGKLHRLGVSRDGRASASTPSPRVRARAVSETRQLQGRINAGQFNKPRAGVDFGPSIKAEANPPKLRVVAAAPADPRPFSQLSARQCRWPCEMSVRVETTTESLFCAAVTPDGQSYCPAHNALSQNTTTKVSSVRSLEKLASRVA